MRARPSIRSAAVVMSLLAATAACSDDAADQDRLDPDGESIIDENETDDSIVEELEGNVNQIDDVEDDPDVDGLGDD